MALTQPKRGGALPAPLFADHASKYLTTSEHIDAAREASSAEDYAPHDEIATRFIDDLLLMYVTKESSPADEREFNQLVVVGDTHDTRALRLPLPRGTAVYLVGPLDGHIDAERRLKAAGDARPRVAPGCVLRRVAVELGASDDTWLEKLEAAGFRGDRLSVWCLQGLAEAASGDVGAAFAHTLSEVADGAALGSVVLVDARGDKGAVEECLATNGLLGGCLPYGGEDTSFGRWREEDDAVVPVQEGRWLAVAEQQRTSLAQMDDFYRYGAEMEDAGEDWDASWNYS
ncbi:unnamed protein product [Pedinophyceae sp. YPF-701]|nr:unnamed protein product [Pedinophyceae sp. YPF-701]